MPYKKVNIPVQEIFNLHSELSKDLQESDIRGEKKKERHTKSYRQLQTKAKHYGK